MNLDVGGVDFLTDENPVGRQGLWMLFAIIGIDFALVLWAAWLAWACREQADWQRLLNQLRKPAALTRPWQ